jgi:hypothetical protein
LGLHKWLLLLLLACCIADFAGSTAASGACTLISAVNKLLRYDFYLACLWQMCAEVTALTD